MRKRIIQPFAFTILLSAFLLFQVQPILGRYILPWFGGGAGVWTTCMLFFQVLLLGGYAYAHLLNTRLRPRGQMWVHLSLLGLTLLFMPMLPRGELVQPPAEGSPALAILLTLFMRIGLPYFMLASTGPLVQSWFSKQHEGQSPYRLYALSNAGSLAALLTYPFVIEPAFGLSAQGWAWTAGFVLFILASGYLAVRFGKSVSLSPSVPTSAADAVVVAPDHGKASQRGRHPSVAGADKVPLTPGLEILSWLALPAIGSVMLLAVTNQICLDLAPIPLLWVVPLAIYLITFIICFDRESWYRRSIFVPLLAGSVILVNLLLHDRRGFSIPIQIAAFNLTLFAACMVCHGELVRLKPASNRLTTFYLCVSGGGAIGGFLVAIVAPMILVDLWEFHFGLLAACLVAALCLCFGAVRVLTPSRQRLSYLAAAAIWGVLAFSMYVNSATTFSSYLINKRNFYGVLHLREEISPLLGPMRLLAHGTTTHGWQFFDGAFRRLPTSYYGYDSGAGLALEFMSHPDGQDGPRKPIHVGVVGLGAGTMNAHLVSHDRIDYYEIDADVEQFARTQFTFIKDSGADTRIHLGDARLVLRRQADAGQLQQFDVLCIDAFTSDSIPMHLVTTEAVALYDSHIKHDTGVIAFHVSNRYLDLEPVIRGLAASRDMKMISIVSPGQPDVGTLSSDWILLTRNQSLATNPRIQLAAEFPTGVAAKVITWTDNYSSLRDVVYLGGRPGGGRWMQAAARGVFVMDGARMMGVGAARELQWQLRRLYAESGRRSPFMIITVGQVPREVDPKLTAESYAQGLYDSLGLGARSGRGVLMVVVTDEQDIQLQLGAGWPDSARERFNRVLNELRSSNVLKPEQTAHLDEALRGVVARIGSVIRQEYAISR